MTYDLPVINNRIQTTPHDYVMESETYYNSRVRKAADEIVNNIDISPIVLLSGPSGSGKTTTAKKLSKELKRLGITAYNVSLDNYFRTVDPETAPRTLQGEIDYESPECLDMQLLNEHFDKLDSGEQIEIPHFSFSKQERVEGRVTPMKLGPNDIAIFEGIHALNEAMTAEHPGAYNIYVSTLTDITDKGKIIIDSAGIRLVRRLVRDDFFRGSDPEMTLSMWDNIRRGEHLYVVPYHKTANFTIDSALPYEISVMKQFTGDMLSKVPDNAEHFQTLHLIIGAFDRFLTVDPAFVPTDSILREFIGGSEFEY